MAKNGNIFYPVEDLKDEEIVLRLKKTSNAIPEKDWLPAYHFLICQHDGTEVGYCDLRIGHNYKTYIGGNIGYGIYEKYRGHHYAGKACQLLFKQARKHGLEHIIISCAPENIASGKTCEYVGGKLLEIADVPVNNEMYAEGKRKVKVYRVELEKSNLSLEILGDDNVNGLAQMLTNLLNYHRKLTSAPEQYWQTIEESVETIHYWKAEGEIYQIRKADEVIGFLYLRLGGQNVAWLEDIYIEEEYRGYGYGKEVIRLLDKMMIQREITSMFVSVIPRNIRALKLYHECGFDHLNMIELRKNYDKELDKTDIVEVLGYQFKKY
ncbi:GNAT family N-acetyltransferase [Clostridiales bacterium COT073_COT-073]|nr:GNAT family N-acetyltransferase [Clostridiales bacterium COT073_COT-073]